jgi:hypothetical protein
MYPWGFSRKITPDHDAFVALADSCVLYNGYDARLAAELYLVSGDTDDWFYGEQELKNKIYAFTPEVGNEAESVGGWTGFFPDTAYIEKQVTENQGPMYYLAYAAGEEPILFAQGPEDTLESGASFNVSARIEQPIPLGDPAQLDEASVYVHYNTTGIAPFESQRLAPDPAQPDIYSGDIAVNGTGVDVYYYVSASDTRGRIGHAPRYAPHALYKFHVTEALPLLTASPDTLVFTLNKGAIVEDSLALLNHTDVAHNFTIEDAEFSAAVVRVDPHQGTIDANDSVRIALSVEGIQAGLDTAALSFSFHNPEHASLHVPLIITVNPASDLDPYISSSPVFILHQNFPNPFNASTAIRYQLSDISDVNLSIVNLSGQLVRSLVNETQPPGDYTARWDGLDDGGNLVSSGLYLYRIVTGSETLTRKLMMMK